MGVLVHKRHCSDAASVATLHHWVHNMKTLHHPVNWKYITNHNTDRRGHGNTYRKFCKVRTCGS